MVASNSTEDAICELTDSELDLVCGGCFGGGGNFVQINIAVQIALVFGGMGSVVQLLSQSNGSNIGNAVGSLGAFKPFRYLSWSSLPRIA